MKLHLLHASWLDLETGRHYRQGDLVPSDVYARYLLACLKEAP